MKKHYKPKFFFVREKDTNFIIFIFSKYKYKKCSKYLLYLIEYKSFILSFEVSFFSWLIVKIYQLDFAFMCV